MSKVAITGLNGVIGQILAEELPSSYQIVDLYRSSKYSGRRKIQKHIKLDLLNQQKISKTLDEIKPDVIIHMAAITHIDKCEKDRENKLEGVVWRTNVIGTKEIAKYASKKNIHLIFLSTECVFDGKKEFYDEKSKKNPNNWYGITKSSAEDEIFESKARSAIIRSVVAYHKNDKGKTIYGKILKKLRSEQEIYSVFDQKFTPTFTYDIVKAMNIILEKKLTGIFHVSPEKNTTPYELTKIIAKKNNMSLKKIKKEKLVEYYKDTARFRLKNSSLKGVKTNKILGFVPQSPNDAL